jgi:hypothetical protein
MLSKYRGDRCRLLVGVSNLDLIYKGIADGQNKIDENIGYP